MATQQDIHAAGAENRPPMLSKGGYSQWASRMMRYLKSKANGSLLIKSIVDGPFKPSQVLDPGDPNGTPQYNHTTENRMRLNTLWKTENRLKLMIRHFITSFLVYLKPFMLLLTVK